MRFTDERNDSEGDSFVAVLRSGQWLLFALAAAGLAWLGWAIVVGVTDRGEPIEYLIVAAVWLGPAILCWPYLKLVYWRDHRFVVSATRVSRGLVGGGFDAVVEVGGRDMVTVAQGRLTSRQRRRGSDYKVYDVRVGSEPVLTKIHSKRCATQLADRLQHSIDAHRRAAQNSG